MIAGATRTAATRARSARTSYGPNKGGGSGKAALRTGRLGDTRELQHRQLRPAVRVADRQLHQKPVELRLGERIGPLVFDRILGCEHPERLGKGDRLVADGDLTLLHRLQKRTLHLGRGPVDFVGQQHTGDQGAGADIERPGRRAVNLGARQVGRKQVRGELDPAERKVERAGQARDGAGLGETRNPFDQT